MTYIYLDDLYRADAGIPCGNGYISKYKKCSKNKGSRVADLSKEKRQQLANEIRRTKGLKKKEFPQSGKGGTLATKGGALALREKTGQGKQSKAKSTGDKELDKLVQKGTVEKSDVIDLVKKRAQKLTDKDLDDIAQRSTEQDFMKKRKSKNLREAKIEVAREAMKKTFNKEVELADRDIADTESKLSRTKSEKSKKSLERKLDQLKKDREIYSKRAEEASNLSDDEALKRGEARFQSDKQDQLQRFKADREVAAAADIGSRVGLGADSLREANWGASTSGKDGFDLISENLRSRKARSSAFADLSDNPSESDLKKAYRMAAAKAHPDRGGTKEAFQELNAEYEAERRRLGFDSLVRGDAFNWAQWEDISRYCTDFIYI